jgi:hypothetical protein
MANADPSAELADRLAVETRAWLEFGALHLWAGNDLARIETR